MFNLLMAVKFLHSSNILHRDLKPSNILITESCSVKLCDFGFARSLKVDEKDLHTRFARKLSTVCVSRFYRPPEIILQKPHYDHKMEVWSIGCIISELLSGMVDCDSNHKSTILFKGKSCYPASPLV